MILHIFDKKTIIEHVIQSEYNEVYSLIEGSRQMDKNTMTDNEHIITTLVAVTVVKRVNAGHTLRQSRGPYQLSGSIKQPRVRAVRVIKSAA